jgi:16S rRNA (guanine(966)-N(2))-methyltransferase RsmD
MRIIAGKYRSRKIFDSPALKKNKRIHNLRPTSDRAREMLFNILSNKIDFNGIKSLDLFAGTGSFGFECLSRGAEHCTFVDLSRTSQEIIFKTAKEIDCSEKTEFIHEDSLSFLKSNSDEFDLIFADPPYNYQLYEELAAAITQKTFSAAVIELSSRSEFSGFSKEGFSLRTKQSGLNSFKILLRQNEKKSHLSRNI